MGGSSRRGLRRPGTASLRGTAGRERPRPGREGTRHSAGLQSPDGGEFPRLRFPVWALRSGAAPRPLLRSQLLRGLRGIFPGPGTQGRAPAPPRIQLQGSAGPGGRGLEPGDDPSWRGFPQNRLLVTGACFGLEIFLSVRKIRPLLNNPRGRNDR